MPQIIPIRDLKNTSEISDRCRAAAEPIFKIALLSHLGPEIFAMCQKTGIDPVDTRTGRIWVSHLGTPKWVTRR